MMKFKKPLLICSCLLLGSCADRVAPSTIQYDILKNDTLKKYKCLKTKYDSVLIQEISYCFGPIYREQRRAWSLRYFSKNTVKHLLEEKERYENRKLPKCSIFTDPASQSYTDAVILPKGTNIFVEKLWTTEANWKTGAPSIGFIGKLNIDNSEYRFRFSEFQLLTTTTDGNKTYNNYETDMYYEYWPYRDDTLKELKRVSSREVSVKEYLDELYDRCD